VLAGGNDPAAGPEFDLCADLGLERKGLRICHHLLRGVRRGPVVGAPAESIEPSQVSPEKRAGVNLIKTSFFFVADFEAT